jgi:hypothetical protein
LELAGRGGVIRAVPIRLFVEDTGSKEPAIGQLGSDEPRGIGTLLLSISVAEKRLPAPQSMSRVDLASAKVSTLYIGRCLGRRSTKLPLVALLIA